VPQVLAIAGEHNSSLTAARKRHFGEMVLGDASKEWGIREAEISSIVAWRGYKGGLGDANNGSEALLHCVTRTGAMTLRNRESGRRGHRRRRANDQTMAVVTQ